MGMSAPVFERACGVAARTFGRKANVQVVFRGDSAETNGSTIVLPSLDRSKELTDEQVAITRGYVDHEAGHVLYTDGKAYTKGVRDAERRNDALCATYINALEDMRIERRILDTYPGSRTNLAATADAVNKSFLDIVKENPEVMKDMRQIGPLAVTWAGRLSMGHTIASLDECLSMMDEEHRQMVTVWADAAIKCRDTKDIVALAERIAKETREKHNEPEPSPGDGDDDDENEESEDGDGDGKSRRKKRQRPQNGEETSEDSEDKVLDDEGIVNPEDGDEEEDSASHGQEEDDEDEDEHEPFDVNINLINVLGNDTSGESYRPMTTEFDRVQTRKSPHDPGNLWFGEQLRRPNGNKVYARDMEMIGPHVGTMARKLNMALLDKERRDWGGGHQQGRFDNKRMVAAMRGNPNVFKIREDTNAVNTAIQILVDCSGSMDGNKIVMARQTAVALSQAIDGTGCALEILGFGNNKNDAACRTLRKMINDNSNAGNKFSRWWPNFLYEFKSFSDDIRHCRQTIGSICGDLVQWNCNADGEHLLDAYARLAVRPEAKKIMIVLSDGHPFFDCSFNPEHRTQHLRDAIAYIMAQGVKTIGIGIKDDSVSQFYPNYTVVHDVGELSGRAIDMVSNALLGKPISPSENLLKASSNAARMKR